MLALLICLLLACSKRFSLVSVCENIYCKAWLKLGSPFSYSAPKGSSPFSLFSFCENLAQLGFLWKWWFRFWTAPWLSNNLCQGVMLTVSSRQASTSSWSLRWPPRRLQSPSSSSFNVRCLPLWSIAHRVADFMMSLQHLIDLSKKGLIVCF